MARFIILFKGSSTQPILAKEEAHIGTELIEALAQEAGIDPEGIDNWAPPRSEWLVEVELGLEKAREIPPLRQSGLVKVIVPEGFLNRFAVLRLVHDEGRNGEPHRLQWEVDNDLLLEAWANAGFPLEWGTGGEDAALHDSV